MPIDTYKAVKDLTGAGLSEEAAEKITALVSTREEELATKSDLKLLQSDIGSLRSDLEGQIKVLRSDIERQMEALERRLTVRLYVGLGVAVALLKALDFLL